MKKVSKKFARCSFCLYLCTNKVKQTFNFIKGSLTYQKHLSILCLKKNKDCAKLMNNHLKNKNMQKDFSKGLQPALDQLPHGEVKQAAEDLKKILGITSTASFWYYRTGRKIPRADEAQKIMEYFKKWHIDVYE